jgi:hypothetical protein
MSGRSRTVVLGVFLIGVVVDAVAALALALPAGSPVRQLAYPGVDATQTAFADGARTAFPLMLGWTILLAWGAFAPVERRALLLVTLPVVLGFVVVESLDISAGHASLAGTAPTFAIQTVLVVLLITAWRLADLEARGDDLSRRR